MNAPFGEYDFAQTVGLRARYGGYKSDHLLSPFISTEGFAFTPEEYVELRERLHTARRKLRGLPRNSAALEDLNTGFFRHQGLEESREFLTAYLSDFLTRGRALLVRFLEATNGYTRRSRFLRQRQLEEQGTALDHLAELSALPEGRRLRRQRMAQLRAAWSRYRTDHLGLGDLPDELPTPEQLQEQREQVTAVRKGLKRELATAGLALNHLTVEPGQGDADELRQLGEELDALVRAVDEAGVYQLPLAKAPAATASRQLQQLEALLLKLRTTLDHLPEFNDFYARRRYWYEQPARLRRLLAPMLELPAEDWDAAFAAWYFDRCLESADAAGRAHYDCDDLQKLSEETIVKRDDELPDGLVVMDKGDTLPPGTTHVIDLSGGHPPSEYTGEWSRKAEYGASTAAHYAVAGLLDPRLTLLQPFHPNEPAPWREVGNAGEPAGANGIAVQHQGQGDWVPLAEWSGTEGGELALYLPWKFSAADGAALVSKFEALLLAGERLTVFHNWSQDDITRALLTDGPSPAFFAAALLRAAEACGESPFDRDALVAIGREIMQRCAVDLPAAHPLAEVVAERLRAELPGWFFTVHQPWRDTWLPLVVQAPNGRKSVLLPDGRLPGGGGAITQAHRQRELRIAGFHCHAIDAYAFWEDAMVLTDQLSRWLTQNMEH